MSLETFTPCLRLGALFVAVFLLTEPAKADSVELRIAVPWPTGNVYVQSLDSIASQVKEKTAGRVAIQFAGGVQQSTDNTDVLRMIRLGQLDGVDGMLSGLSGIDESISVLGLPMLFDSPEELDYVADKMWPYFQTKFEQKGYRLSERGEALGKPFLSTSKMESIADLKNLKLWQSGGDRGVGALYKNLGFTGAPLGIAEIEGALTSARVQAVYGSPLLATTFLWDSKVRHMTSLTMTYDFDAIAISSESLKKISAEDQKTLEGSLRIHLKKRRRTVRTGNAQAQSAMMRKGIVLSGTPTAMKDAFVRAASDSYASLVGKGFSKEELDMVLKYRAEYRAKGKP